MYHCIKIRTVVLQYAPLYYNTHRCITIRTIVLQYAPLYYNTYRCITIRKRKYLHLHLFSFKHFIPLD